MEEEYGVLSAFTEVFGWIRTIPQAPPTCQHTPWHTGNSPANRKAFALPRCRAGPRRATAWQVVRRLRYHRRHGVGSVTAEALVKRFHYPATLASALLLGAGLIALGWSPGWILASTGLLFALLSFWMERRFAQQAQGEVDPRELRTDVLHALISNTVPTALFRALFFAAVVGASSALTERFGFSLWPAHWPLAGQFLLALAIVELVSYAIHRALHRSRLWPLHAVHHCSSRMYFLLAVRKHPLQAFLTYGGRLSVLWLLGLPEDTLTLLLVFTGANSYLQHSNIRMETGAFRYVFATPELHRLHHARRAAAIDCNFGDVLIVWDLLFGTRREPPAGPSSPEEVGLPDIEIPQTYINHLRLPFEWSERHTAARSSR